MDIRPLSGKADQVAGRPAANLEGAIARPEFHVAQKTVATEQVILAGDIVNIPGPAVHPVHFFGGGHARRDYNRKQAIPKGERVANFAGEALLHHVEMEPTVDGGAVFLEKGLRECFLVIKPGLERRWKGGFDG